MSKVETLRNEISRLEHDVSLYTTLAKLKQEQADRTHEIAKQLTDQLTDARSKLVAFTSFGESSNEPSDMTDDV